MIVDGERFDAPVHLTVKDFFMINDRFFLEVKLLIYVSFMKINIRN